MDQRPGTRTATTALVAALVVVLVSGCSTASPVPVASPTASPPSGATPIQITPAEATPPALDDPDFPTPPIPKEGDVPPYEESTPVTGHLTLGTPSDAASTTIGTAGGTLEGDGLRIDFAPETLAADTTFSVWATPIAAADFGGVVTPLTALYTVEGGDVSLSSPATVTLAATIPPGATAMAFWYDDAASRLTPLMPIAQDATSLTVGATHFSDIFGALVDLAGVSATVDSGFRPGIDDWQFANYGSYVAPGGHCEGQSVSAIWYYVNQRRQGGASALHGLYDNNGAPDKTPTFQWDDSDGYRFVSSVQADPIAVPFTYKFLRNATLDSAQGRLTYDAFRAAIAFSGEPQLIAIRPAQGDSGHAMIVYRVTPERLFIADPNYPARLRTIRYDAATGKLAPYSSGANAAEIAANGATVFTRFAYVPWRASSSEAALAAHWADFEAGTAGDGVFPPYALEALPGVDSAGTESWVPLVDGYQTAQSELKIRLRDPSNANHVTMQVYPGTSSTPLSNWGSTQTIQLEDGVNDLGIIVVFAKQGGPAYQYVDFVRLTVARGGMWGTAQLVHTLDNLDPTEQGSTSLECTFDGLAELRMDGGQWEVLYHGESWHSLDGAVFVCGGDDSSTAVIVAGSYTTDPLAFSLDEPFACDDNVFNFDGVTMSGVSYAYCGISDVYSFNISLDEPGDGGALP